MNKPLEAYMLKKTDIGYDRRECATYLCPLAAAGPRRSRLTLCIAPSLLLCRANADHAERKILSEADSGKNGRGRVRVISTRSLVR